MKRSLLLAISLAGCSGALNTNQDGGPGGSAMVGTAGTMGGGLAGRGGSGGTGGTAGIGQPWGGDAGFGCPPTSWTPPDAPDGGYAPVPAAEQTNGKPGCNSGDCSSGASSNVTLDDRSLGFSATELLAEFSSPGTGELTWYDGTSTTLHFVVNSARSTATLSSSQTSGAGGISGTVPLCQTMEVPNTTISLSTDDGRLTGEEFEGVLVARLLDGARTVWGDFFYIPVSGLHGSFRVPDVWASALDGQTLDFVVTPEAESCSANCAPSPGAHDTAWANPFLCGFDGKITWADSFASPLTCNHTTTVATWRWAR